jgi:threonine/homoserine/homoserine lactone efflux protein
MGSTFAALLLYAFVATVTPGPNNLMVLTSGVNFGFRRSIPHMLGITLGFALMVVLIGLGMAQIFQLYPPLFTGLKVAGGLYMLWLAWKIALSGPIGEAGAARGAPMTFIGAALFQWVNPKAWMMGLTAVATYVMVDNLMLNCLIIASVFALLTFPCVALWAGFGVGLKHVLDNPQTLRTFNIVMAALLVLSLWPALKG